MKSASESPRSRSDYLIFHYFGCRKPHHTAPGAVVPLSFINSCFVPPHLKYSLQLILSTSLKEGKTASKGRPHPSLKPRDLHWDLLWLPYLVMRCCIVAQNHASVQARRGSGGSGRRSVRQGQNTAVGLCIFRHRLHLVRAALCLGLNRLSDTSAAHSLDVQLSEISCCRGPLSTCTSPTASFL